MNETLERRGYGVNIGNVILGFWVIISPFVLGFSRLDAAKWNDIAVGAAVVLLALNRGSGAKAASILNVLLGAWLIASPFVLGFAAAVPFWNNIILGIAILVVAMIATSSTRVTTTDQAGPQTH